MKTSAVILISALSALGAYATAHVVQANAKKPEAAKIETVKRQELPTKPPAPAGIKKRAASIVAKADQKSQVKTAAQRPVKTAQVAVPIKSVARPAPKKKHTTPFLVRRCMNIGNALEAPNEGEWGYTIRAKDFQTVADAGFDTVRIPIRWDAHTSFKEPYLIDPKFMARVQRVVGDARTVGLKVIIDVHHFENLMANTDHEEARFLSIWNQIGRAFANAPSSVYFEILNEPTREISTKRLNELYAKIVPIIRRTNPSRILIMGGNSWNSIETLEDVKWPKDANIVATFHDYGPHEFTHQGAEWMNPRMPMGRAWGHSKADKKDLSSTYAMARKFQARTGLPVFVGEFGVIDKVPQSQRNQWIKTRRKTIEAAGFSWCAWDFSGAFKSYDARTERWMPGILDAYIGR